MKCDCPIYCRYCGAKLKRDATGHYCPTRNCQWQYGASTCTPQDAEEVDGIDSRAGDDYELSNEN